MANTKNIPCLSVEVSYFALTICYKSVAPKKLNKNNIYIYIYTYIYIYIYILTHLLLEKFFFTSMVFNISELYKLFTYEHRNVSY